MQSFDLDPDFPDRLMGWAVFRPYPWDLAGFFVDSAHAHQLRNDLGNQYFVRHGSKNMCTDDFSWWREDERDHLIDSDD